MVSKPNALDSPAPILAQDKTLCRRRRRRRFRASSDSVRPSLLIASPALERPTARVASATNSTTAATPHTRTHTLAIGRRTSLNFKLPHSVGADVLCLHTKEIKLARTFQPVRVLVVRSLVLGQTLVLVSQQLHCEIRIGSIACVRVRATQLVRRF